MKSKLQTFLLTLYAMSILAGCDLDSPGAGYGADGDSPDVSLWFSGASFGDEIFYVVDEPEPIALGGSQTIHVWLDDKANEPFDMRLDGEEGLAFTVVSGGKHYLEIMTGNVNPPEVTIHGNEEGTEELRIKPLGSAPDVEYARYDLEVVKVANVRIVDPPDILFQLIHGNVEQRGYEKLAYAVGSQPSKLVVGLFTEDERRAVDESIEFGDLPSNLEKDTGTWDTLKVNTPFEESGELAIEVKAGDGTDLGTATIQVVDTVKNVEIAVGSDPRPEAGELVIDTNSKVCFNSLGIDGSLIYGAVVTVEAKQNVVVERYEENQNNPLESKSCWNIRAQSPANCTTGGCATIRVFSKATNLDDEDDWCGDGSDDCKNVLEFDIVDLP